MKEDDACIDPKTSVLFLQHPAIYKSTNFEHNCPFKASSIMSA